MTAPRLFTGLAAAAAAAALATGAAAQPVGAGGLTLAPASSSPSPSTPMQPQLDASAGPRAAAQAADAPLLLWTALGASTLALLLGGAALAVSLRQRAEPAPADLTFTPAPDRRLPDRRLTERVERLEAALRELQVPSRRGLDDRSPSPAAVDAFPPRGAPAWRDDRALGDPRDGIAPATGAARGQAAASDGPALDPWLAAVTAAFARLARDPSAAAPAFIARLRPQGASADMDGVVLLDGFEGAKLWATPAPAVSGGGDEVWALVPGEAAAVNWTAHFAARRDEVAAEVFGSAFDLEPGGGEALRMEAAALARRDPATGRLSVIRRGRLAGFRS